MGRRRRGQKLKTFRQKYGKVEKSPGLKAARRGRASLGFTRGRQDWASEQHDDEVMGDLLPSRKTMVASERRLFPLFYSAYFSPVVCSDPEIPLAQFSPTRKAKVGGRLGLGDGVVGYE
ncbi:hypothetical protein TIFTF001_022132 [Ficus carica]|uniref:Uncharacterized protein n=1 Tax=Ficus carica TaxID=3494 RepID=A0AA88AI33_FICCA|nr:hypothetical protein TIFTF001_022132 [Ficus carica]